MNEKQVANLFATSAAATKAVNDADFSYRIAFAAARANPSDENLMLESDRLYRALRTARTISCDVLDAALAARSNLINERDAKRVQLFVED